MYRACSRCGKIHDSKYKCNVNRVYQGGKERQLRNTYQWHKKADETKAKANYLCEVCKDHNIYTYNNLEVHHIEKLKNRPEGLLDDYNLICLCIEHHRQADNGQLDKDYLLKLAKDRESI